jgi:hypothetical protein
MRCIISQKIHSSNPNPGLEVKCEPPIRDSIIAILKMDVVCSSEKLAFKCQRAEDCNLHTHKVTISFLTGSEIALQMHSRKYLARLIRP